MQMGKHPFQRGAALMKLCIAEITVIHMDQIEKDDGGGRLLRQQLVARCRGMQAKRERVKIQSVLVCNDDLAIQNAALRQLLQERS